MKRSILISATLAISSIAFAADGDDAMLGFKWGMSVQDVKAAGSRLEKKDTNRSLEIYEVSSVPKPLSDFEIYMLIFADGKLVKISAVGNDISGDPTGIKGKEQFKVLENTMKEKYGDPKHSYKRIGSKLYKEYDEFYQCLAYDGCGTWASIFETKDKSVVLEMNGVRRGTGYLRIVAESKPQWSNAIEKHKTKKASSDKDAL